MISVFNYEPDFTESTIMQLRLTRYKFTKIYPYIKPIEIFS